MLRAGHGLILAVVALLTFGVVMVNSAGLSIDPEQTFELRDVIHSRVLWYAVVAVGLMLIAAHVPVDELYRGRGLNSAVLWIALLSVALLLLVYVPMLGHRVNGALRWIKVGAITFQPSEFAKWGVLIVLAWHATRRAGAMGRMSIGFLPPMVFVGLLCVLIAMEDLGTAVLIGAVSVLVLWAAGCRWWQVGSLLPLGAAGFLAAVIHSPYRLDRLRAYADPYADPQGIGYHVIQSMASVAGGGLTGRGLGNSVQKFGYLPESTTDFIFAIICEELGVLGALTVVALYGVLLACGLTIIRRTTHPFQKLLGLGVMLMIAMQALINMAVVTGAAPAKGIALPLISSGGSGWLLTAMSIGLLVSIDRELWHREQAEAAATIRAKRAAEAEARAEAVLKPEFERMRDERDKKVVLPLQPVAASGSKTTPTVHSTRADEIAADDADVDGQSSDMQDADVGSDGEPAGDADHHVEPEGDVTLEEDDATCDRPIGPAVDTSESPEIRTLPYRGSAGSPRATVTQPLLFGSPDDDNDDADRP